MLPVVALIFDIRQGLYHPSCLYAGLDALDRRGAITFLIRRPQGEQERRLAETSPAVYMKIKADAEHDEQLVVVDFDDRSDRFKMGALEACDVYLKRSFYRPDLERLGPGLAEKVLPYGLNYACITHGSTRRFFSAVGWRFALQGYQGYRNLVYGHLLLPKTGDFEQLPIAPVDPTIVFQTRVWHADETAPGEDEQINEGRVRLIRSLREAFGERFIGGLVPTPLALARYPGDVSRHPSRRKLYTAMSKRSLIGIYTRGLHGSTAFKLAECLAASQCIVAEPPRNEPPTPLEAGRHYLPFHSADECVAACRRLLGDDKLASAMRRENHVYYLREVEPGAHVTRVIEKVVHSGSGIAKG